MLKLLNEQDRAAVKANTLSGTPGNWLSTLGIGVYRCGECTNFSDCSVSGCSADLMPCTLSPKNPLKFFRPASPSGNAAAVLNQLEGLSLDQKILVEAAVHDVVERAVLKKVQRAQYPYGVDDVVQVIWQGTIKTVTVKNVTPDGVEVQVGELTAVYPHGAAIPPRE